MTGDGEWVGSQIVYHNTRYHPGLGLTRDHDEKRLYRTAMLDRAFELDRNVIFALARIDDDSYVGLSDSESKIFADEFSGIALPDAPIDLEALKTTCPSVYKELSRRIELAANPLPGPSISNQDEFIKLVKTSLEKVGPAETLDDPLAALTTVFRTQADFASMVREIYSGKCALRNTVLVEGTATGLEAAHIYPRADSRNFLPSNGFLLSRDLHNAFDLGYWTLTESLEVEIHPKAPNGELKKFAGVKLNIPVKHQAFKPYVGYIRWHRANVFGAFLKLGGHD